MTNLACAVYTPAQLVSWDHIAQLSHLLSEVKLELGMVKADHEAAYKQLPIDPADQALTIIALRCPKANKWYGIVTRTLVFGAVAAVLRYNVFSRSASALVFRVLGIPTVCFFDDFSALVRLGLVDKAPEVFSRICQLFGIGLKPGKPSAGGAMAFLGLLGSFP